MKTASMAALALLACTGAAYAQTTGQQQKGGMQQKLSMADCQQVWSKANPGGEPSVSHAKVEQWVTDVKKVDANNDGMISSAEFTEACGQGYVRSAAAGGAGGATGAGAGTAGQGQSATKPAR